MTHNKYSNSPKSSAIFLPRLNFNRRKHMVYLVVNVILSQSGFSVKVKGQTKRGRQMNKGTGIGRETHDTFADLTGMYKVAHKYCHR